MGTVSVALFFLFLVFLCFPISLDSQKLDPSTSSLNQEEAHAELTIKDIKGGEDDKSIDIFRAGKGGRGVTGGKGGGRKASPKKRNAAMDHRPPLFFSAASVLFTGFIMFSLTSFNSSLRFCSA
ncbi:T24D18.13 [Arabidopsis thaliana]|jgi:hypothetical protein|uniref:T24D18.13 n=2 Tax=Arabidopsis thaliana TaxID=3702 RepID=Q9S9N2_ARATH|nr:uncharacterized protein AT1G16022 [Arabidopsis thaliana]AAF18500.1 T24D18.13 [Arabidopsis thaliana]AEE29400.2 transmembrane protein [Arabidopsis thaliana]OAP16786.1 hypothetical protein AXX17_AT1G16800 [Arabidopsis thaliana]CAA0209578.1 unnamed protein product [Arabidopsis thaliana]VYS46235.1 unnamed protein product [Arabidopsis thaliana]|eukprot:NP_001319015.1 transmembrane protein [Arabidopsis thaliana]